MRISDWSSDVCSSDLRFIADGPPSLETIRATFLSIAPEGYAACCAAISGVDLIDRLPNLRQPTLVINGSLDAATPPAEHGDRIAAAVPNARPVVLKAGHLSPRTDERRVGKGGVSKCNYRGAA